MSDDLAAFFAGAGAQEDAYEGDPLERLTAAMITASGGISSASVREFIFLELYCGPAGRQIVERVVSMKLRQNPGVLRRLERVGGMIALREFMGKISGSFSVR